MRTAGKSETLLTDCYHYDLRSGGNCWEGQNTERVSSRIEKYRSKKEGIGTLEKNSDIEYANPILNPILPILKGCRKAKDTSYQSNRPYYLCLQVPKCSAEILSFHTLLSA